jgi:succinate dehydrogenase hydrophobic anchor subunit
MDYIHATAVRLSLEVLTLVLLAVYVGWTVQILWR